MCLLEASDVHAYRRFAPLVPFVADDLEDPMCSVVLLARKVFVFLQQLRDTIFKGSKNGLGLLARSWTARMGFVGEGFANGCAMTSFFACNPVNALLFDVVTSANPFPFLFVQVHHPFLP